MKDSVLRHFQRFLSSQEPEIGGGKEYVRKITVSRALTHLLHPSGEFPVIHSLHQQFSSGHSGKSKLPCFRVMTARGQIAQEAKEHAVEPSLLLKIYKTMVQVRKIDETFYQAQRQGRIPFYLDCRGEEASVVASAAALKPCDTVFSQYREHGAFLWRGFSAQDMAYQCLGREKENGKGRQMPMHFGDKSKNCHTVSSPLATQLPHAVGYAYTRKLEQDGSVVACYFGEGAASEGDFHAALNFAATLECPVIFICRNNGWAISTPVKEQFRGDGIAARGFGYGIKSLRVDGGDAQAVYIATAKAREHVTQTMSPVLLELMAYRMGHHSTSDDARRYVPSQIQKESEASDPLKRLKNHLVGSGILTEILASKMEEEAITEARRALVTAENEATPPLESMFDDVYDVVPYHLIEQREEAIEERNADYGALDSQGTHQNV